MREGLPPQRRAGGSGPGGRPARNLSPREGAEEAGHRLGLPCFHVGQRVPGLVRCVTCQMQIRNRGTLPACPDCGELVWAWMEPGPPPVPEGEQAAPAPPGPTGPTVEDNVRLEGPGAPVQVQENVKLEP